MRSLASRGTLVLTVRVANEEQAEQIADWMYADDKPMLAQLDEIAWDRTTVSLEVAEAIETIRRDGTIREK